MRDHYALRAFRTIAEHGSFTRAAAALDVTASALSQTLRRLEQQLGARLLHRTTRRVGLTEAGHVLLARIAPALNELDAAMEALRQHDGRPSGTLRLTMPQLPWLLEARLAEFMTRWSEVQLDIHVDNNLSDLIAEGFDAGIRLGERLQRDMVAVPISGPVRSVVAGSPAYFERQGRPRHPRDLQTFPCVKFRHASSGALYRWEFAQRSGPHKGRWFEIAVEGGLIVNDMTLAVRAASDGIGLVYALEPVVREALADGRLESVLDLWLPPFEGFYLYYPSRFQVPPKLRVFIDFMRQQSENSVRVQPSK